MRTLVLRAGLLLVLCGVVPSAQTPPAARFDVILRRGMVLDGSGLPRIRADVAIAGGSIARVGDLAKEHAALELDVTGLFVAPGFINIHSHASQTAVSQAENMLTQGVTSEIINPDGGGTTDVRDQLARYSSQGLAVNLGGYIGFNAAWAEVKGLADRPSTSDDILKMQEIIVTGLEEGAGASRPGSTTSPPTTHRWKTSSASSRRLPNGGQTFPTTIG